MTEHDTDPPNTLPEGLEPPVPHSVDEFEDALRNVVRDELRPLTDGMIQHSHELEQLTQWQRRTNIRLAVIEAANIALPLVAIILSGASIILILILHSK